MTVSLLSPLFQKQNHLFMGIINITPDSFSDGGKFNRPYTFTQRIQQLNQAHILDLGAESTAPFNAPIAGNLEYRRFQELKVAEYPWQQLVSIDTYRPQTFQMLQDRFTFPLIWNDVSGKLDRPLADVLQRFPRSPYIFGHNLSPKREQTSDHLHYPYRGSQATFREHLLRYFHQAQEFWQRHQLQNPLIFDLCFGFSKTYQQNWYLLGHLEELLELFPQKQCWLIGISRKSFIRKKAREIQKSDEQLHYQLIQRYRKHLKNHRLIFRGHYPQVFFALPE